MAFHSSRSAGVKRAGQKAMTVMIGTGGGRKQGGQGQTAGRVIKNGLSRTAGMRVLCQLRRRNLCVM
jgi:hypothetical protein